jgi:hypothetical protein
MIKKKKKGVGTLLATLGKTDLTFQLRCRRLKSLDTKVESGVCFPFFLFFSFNLSMTKANFTLPIHSPYINEALLTRYPSSQLDLDAFRTSVTSDPIPVQMGRYESKRALALTNDFYR